MLGFTQRWSGIFGLLMIALLAAAWPGTRVSAQVIDCEVSLSAGISATPDSILAGQTAALDVINRDGPSACPLWINDVAVTAGVSLVVSPKKTTTYNLETSTVAGGRHLLASVVVTVSPDCINGIVGTLTALPETVHLGKPSTLSWKVKAPAGCTFDTTLDGTIVASSGVLTVQPEVTTAYALGVLLPNGPMPLTTVTVTVNTKVVYIPDNTDASKERLIKWVGVPGTTVILAPDLDMDLTGAPEPIFITESVTLTSDDGTPPQAVRTARNRGPRLYTRFRPKPMFLIKCFSDADVTYTGDNVRISGFLLEGPHFDTMDGDSNLEKAIQIDSCLNVEISNMEIAGWSGAAIYVTENPDNPRMETPDAVHIHDNYIHNNQHKGGNGYGVDVSAGAYARIEHNVFDLNRHAITASGQRGTGYYAGENLILKGGGVHGTVLVPYTHLLDVHGDRNCPFFLHHIWNCGNAGDEFWYVGNTVQFTRDDALKLRGRPRKAAHINGNVFAHGSVGDAVEYYVDVSKPTTNVFFGKGAERNIAGYDTYGRYGVCDLDGDHKDDLFLATGTTWWYLSAARMNWVFLKPATERLEDVGLGDFNGDGTCDVLAPNGNTWEISPGGSGAWTALPGTYPVPFNQLRFADFNGDGKTDVFRRDSNGQWSVVSPGVHGWQTLQSSSFPLSSLRFGDFTGDGKADVLSLAGGHWSISISGLGSWTKLNGLSTGLGSLLIADVDGNGTDDIVRYKVSSATKGTWEASWGGRSAWTALRTLNVPAPIAQQFGGPLVTLRVFAGQFDGTPGDDLLLIDYVRVGRLFDFKTQILKLHNLFPY
jgi:hypothetical protein